MSQTQSTPGRARLVFQRMLPIVVTTVTLGWIALTFDMAKVAEALTLRVVLIIVPALLGYGVATLALEAWSLLRIVTHPPPDFDSWTAARIKSASYLLGILNYFLGGAALTVLLRRRANLGLGEAASVVLLISMTDLLIVLAFGASAAASQSGAGGPTVRAGIVALAGVGFFGGLALLRAPRSLGPLERLRSLSVFDALRRTPGRRLADLALLRIVVSICFIGIAGITFFAFDLPIGLGRLVVGTMILAIVGAIPIAVAGLGPGQVVAVEVFKGIAEPEELIALSLVLSAVLIILRAAMGAIVAREYTREALAETQREPM